jgi:hypothetical protein
MNWAPDDFALCRGRRYSTWLIDAVTHRRVDVLSDRKVAALREHPEVEVIRRDGSAAYAEAVPAASRPILGPGVLQLRSTCEYRSCWAPDTNLMPTGVGRASTSTAAFSGW